MVNIRALVLLMLAPAALLAETGKWEALLGINSGKSVHIHMLDGHKNSGNFVSTTESSITIRQRTGDQTFPKDQIRKISVRKFGRLRNVAIGAGIGAASAAGVFAGSGGSDEYVNVIIVSVAVFAAAGAGIVALVPGYETVYQIPRK